MTRSLERARTAALAAGLLGTVLLASSGARAQTTPRSGDELQAPPVATRPALEDGIQNPPAATGAGAAASAVETPAQKEPAPAAPPPRSAIPSQVLLLLGLGALVLLGTVVVILAVVLKKPVVINVPSRSAQAAPPPDAFEPPDSPIEGTLKILPGRFMIEEGEKQVELRIFQTSGDDHEETTIGRDPGPPYRHVQLRPASVSGRHAKLVWDRGTYTLVNFSRTNPTRVNGEALAEGASRRLVDEDRIEIGEVAMTYYEV